MKRLRDLTGRPAGEPPDNVPWLPELFRRSDYV